MPFQNRDEDRQVFKNLVWTLARQSSQSADLIEANSRLARWTIKRRWRRPITLDISYREIGGTFIIDLMCGQFDVVPYSNLGDWSYYCNEAVTAVGWPLHHRFSIHENMESLRAAVAEDIEMYLSGRYKRSTTRPRSRVDVIN